MKKYTSKKLKNIDKSKVFGLQITSFLGAILAVLVLVTVIVTIETSASGAQLAYLENEETMLTQENTELKAKIIQSTSLNKIGEVAKGKDLKKATKIIYITEDETVAKIP